MEELRRNGFLPLSGPVLDCQDGIQSAQMFARGCWDIRHQLYAQYPTTFAPISGGVMQVDVDACVKAVGPTRLGAYLMQVFQVSARELLNAIRSLRTAFDTLYVDMLVPACQYVHNIPADQVRRMKGRKMLISGRGCQAQLLHLDSLYSTVVANLYLSTDPRAKIPATRFAEEPEGTPCHPRDLSDPQDAECLLGGLPWNKRTEIGPKLLSHNQAIVFMGNVVHGGPPVHMDALRIVLFQYATPAGSPEEDLSDFQEFEFSMNYRLRGACDPATKAALLATGGRWCDHYDPLIDSEVYSELERALGRQYSA